VSEHFAITAVSLCRVCELQDSIDVCFKEFNMFSAKCQILNNVFNKLLFLNCIDKSQSEQCR